MATIQASRFAALNIDEDSDDNQKSKNKQNKENKNQPQAAKKRNRKKKKADQNKAESDEVTLSNLLFLHYRRLASVSRRSLTYLLMVIGLIMDIVIITWELT